MMSPAAKTPSSAVALVLWLTRSVPQRVTAIAGSSLGGLISLYAGFKHSDVFGRLGVISPALFWADHRVLRFVRERKGVEVYRQTPPRLQHAVRLDRFGWVDGHRPHEPARQVGADGQNRQARRTETAADLREVRTEAGIACEVDDPSGSPQHETRPQRGVAVA